MSTTTIYSWLIEIDLVDWTTIDPSKLAGALDDIDRVLVQHITNNKICNDICTSII